MNCFFDQVQVSSPKTIFLVGLTQDASKDSYHSASAPWLLYLFKLTKLSVKYILFDTNGLDINRITEIGVSIFRYFPSRTIWMSLQHTNGWALDKLLFERKSVGFANNYLLHLNHEHPWSKNISDTRNNQIAPDVYGFEETFIEKYKQFKLVIRQYHYKPFTPYTFYLPLGYATLSWPSIRRKYSIKKSSDRSYFCVIKARFKYQDLSPFHDERRQLKDMQDIGVLPCAMASSDTKIILQQPHFSDYANILMNTVFIPCPSGNNPETFRHYEALEAGAIPIVVKTDSSSSYLSQWGSEYPGPILQSWSQLSSYLGSMNPQSTDVLQQKLQQWYSLYKNRLVEDLTRVLKTVT